MIDELNATDIDWFACLQDTIQKGLTPESYACQDTHDCPNLHCILVCARNCADDRKHIELDYRRIVDELQVMAITS